MAVVALASVALRDAVGHVPGADLVVWDGGTLPDRADEVELVVAPYSTAGLPDLGGFPRLRAVQIQSAGYDGMIAQLPRTKCLGEHRSMVSDVVDRLAGEGFLIALRQVPDVVR